MERSMVKNLGNKIGGVVLLALGAGLGLIIVGPKYNLENSTGRRYYFPPVINRYVQEKGKDEIEYISNAMDDKLKRVIIDKDRFNRKDTLVYSEALKQWNSLKEEMDSVKIAKWKVKYDAKIQKKLDEEQKKTEGALEILRK